MNTQFMFHKVVLPTKRPLAAWHVTGEGVRKYVDSFDMSDQIGRPIEGISVDAAFPFTSQFRFISFSVG